MSDLFTRLAERALGTARVVKPVIAPVFAAPPAPEAAPAIEAERERPKQQGLQNLVEPEPQRPREQPDHPARVAPWRELAVSEPAPVQPVNRPLNPDSPPARPIQHPERALPPEPARIVPQPEVLLLPAQRIESRTTDIHQRTIAPVHMRQPVIQTRPVERPRPQPLDARPESARPVHITIDRIEVRAIHAAVASPPKRTVKPPEPMPLDEYLKQQSGGRR